MGLGAVDVVRRIANDHNAIRRNRTAVAPRVSMHRQCRKITTRAAFAPPGVHGKASRVHPGGPNLQRAGFRIVPREQPQRDRGLLAEAINKLLHARKEPGSRISRQSIPQMPVVRASKTIVVRRPPIHSVSSYQVAENDVIEPARELHAIDREVLAEQLSPGIGHRGNPSALGQEQRSINIKKDEHCPILRVGLQSAQVHIVVSSQSEGLVWLLSLSSNSNVPC